jgi:hypothetical protein
MSRARKAKAQSPPPPEPFNRDKAMAKFRSMTNRGTTVAFVPSGVVVDAKNPAELEEKTNEEIARRTRGEPEN